MVAGPWCSLSNYCEGPSTIASATSRLASNNPAETARSTPEIAWTPCVMSKTFRITTVAVSTAAIAVLIALVLAVPGTGHGRVLAKRGVARTTGIARLTNIKSSSVVVVSGVLGVGAGILLPIPPPPCGCTPAAGTVRLTDAHGHSIYVKTTKSGAFSVRVPAGRYRVVAGLNPPYHWPMRSCTGLSGAGVHFDWSRHVNYLTVGKERRMTIYVGCTAL